MRLFVPLLLLLVIAACNDDGSTNASSNPQPTPPPAESAQYAIGDVVELDHGISITIHDVMDTVIEPKYADPAINDTIAIDVELCAGPELPHGPLSAEPFDFSSRMPDNTNGPVDLGEYDPGFHRADLTANECNRGWISYTYEPGQRPQLLSYDMTYGETTYNVRWQYPQ